MLLINNIERKVKYMEISLMEKSDLDEVLLVTIKAFQDGALYKYIAPDATVRAEFLSKVFKSRLINSMSSDEIYLAKEDGKIVGAATWTLSPQVSDTKKSISETTVDYLSGIPDDVKDRWNGFIKVLMAAKTKSIQSPFWGLSPIVVLPEKQGMGIASKLIRDQLAKIDSEGLTCFLATQDIDNLNIYYRYGFKVTSEDKISDSGVISYTMVRPGIQI